jgi:glutathione peroxidase-family protein/uncharacterized membrane protein
MTYICIAHDLIVKDIKMKTTFFQNSMRILLGAFMTYAGVSHLIFNRTAFLAQVPKWLTTDPGFMDFVVLSSGIVEMVLGLVLIFWVSQKIYVGIALGIFFILIFPGNLSQYYYGIDSFGLNTDNKRLIRLFFQPVLVLWALWSTGALAYLLKKRKAISQQSFYDFEAESIQGKRIPMSTYKGKTVLVVNTASQCGLTPQYEGLEKLYQKYESQGLVILGFPCNQFGKQEKGSATEIETFCQVNYGVSFPMFSKVEVNGSQAHPLFVYLKASLGGVFGSTIKWNFTKFVIDKNGRPVQRFAPITTPETIEKYLQEIL